jgi:hypothetical protein
MGVFAFITVAVALLSATNPIVHLTPVHLGAGNRPSQGSTKQPFFVECHGDRMVIHPQGQKVSPEQMDQAGSPFLRLLDRLAARREREYVIFAVYPDGLSCFDGARKLVEERGIDLGFEPMLAGWQLRFDRQKQKGS